MLRKFSGVVAWGALCVLSTSIAYSASWPGADIKFSDVSSIDSMYWLKYADGSLPKDQLGSPHGGMVTHRMCMDINLKSDFWSKSPLGVVMDSPVPGFDPGPPLEKKLKISFLDSRGEVITGGDFSDEYKNWDPDISPTFRACLYLTQRDYESILNCDSCSIRFIPNEQFQSRRLGLGSAIGYSYADVQNGLNEKFKRESANHKKKWYEFR